MEKKLEKEKNKTQKFFCNKQDLNYQQRNNLYQPSKATGTTEQEENGAKYENQVSKNSTTSGNLSSCPSSTSSFSSNPNIPLPIKQIAKQSELRVERSISLSNTTTKTKDIDLTPRNEQAQIVDSQSFQSKLVIGDKTVITSPSSPLPNAKLPPLRNPKSKIIMKNMQNKQQKQSIENQQKALKSSNLSLNQDPNPEIPANTPNTSQPSLDKTITNKIQRSSSSSVLEKRSNQSKKSRPNSASNSTMAPVYKKLRPIEDPIIQILEVDVAIQLLAIEPAPYRDHVTQTMVDHSWALAKKWGLALQGQVGAKYKRLLT